jgi:TPR repeat protein
MAPTERAKRCRKGAGKGNSEDQFEFGMLYYHGTEGVKTNVATAAEWIQKAATQGLVRAQNFLGDRYEDGDGVVRDMERAVVWWKKAASQDPERYEDECQRESIMTARYNLAYAYATGREEARTVPCSAQLLNSWFQPS